MEECRHIRKCGACRYLGKEYREQLETKRDSVAEAFSSQGLKIKVNEVVGMDSPYHYRNKVIANVSMRNGRISCGMYEENTHKVVDTPDCLLQNEKLNGILNTICTELDSLKIRAYGFEGVLKQILLRIGIHTGQVLVVFVTSDDMFHGRADLVKRITKKHGEIRTVIQNTNPRETSVVLGTREKVLYGSGYIVDDLLGHRFKISARSFYQINPEQTEKLYSKAIELAGIREGETVLDAYCGIGTIGISAAGKAGRIIGVEINGEAVKDAAGNARHNRIDNAFFFCEDVKDFMRGFNSGTDVLIVDPPRTGCDRIFLDAVKKLRPSRIVYISCNPETQARDISVLSDIYKYGEAYPFDMFPQTRHIENIVILSLIS